MKDKVIIIDTHCDTELSLQIVTPSITDATGTREGNKEVALLLAKKVGLDSDGEQVAILNAQQIDELIIQLSSLREQIKK